MRLTLRVPVEVRDTCNMLGGVNKVLQCMYDLAQNNTVEVTDLPSIRCGKMVKITTDFTHPYYEHLCTIYNPSDNRISISRALSAFILNEVYVDYMDNVNKLDYLQYATNAITSLQQAILYAPSDKLPILHEAVVVLNKLK